MKKINSFLLTPLLALICGSASAQVSNIGFEHYSLEQGLSHSTVNCIRQDADGYIWLGTKEGLNRFDGYSFQSFEIDLNDSTTLNGTSVHSLFFDSAQHFWVGTNNGVNLFDAHTFKNHRFPSSVKNGIGVPSGAVWDIKESPKGTIWFATDDGLIKWTEKEQRFQYDTHPELKHKKVLKIAVDKKGNLWLSRAKEGLFYLDINSGNLRNESANGTFEKKEIRGLTFERDNKLWVGTDRGLYCYYTESGKSVAYSPAGEFYIQSSNTTRILVDRDSLVWVGSWGNGLHLLAGNPQRFKAFGWDIRNPQSLGDNFVNDIFEDREGAIWVATSGGVSRYDKNRKNFVNYHTEVGVDNSLSSNIINHVFRDRNQNLWVATKTGGLNRWNDAEQGFDHFIAPKNGQDGLLNNRVNGISEDLMNRIWVATSKGVSVFSPQKNSFRNYAPDSKTFLSASYIQTILCDSLGNIWVGTVAGMDRYIGDKEPYFEPINFRLNNSSERERFLINNIVEDLDHTLWIGTFGNGLLNYDPKTGKTKVYLNDKSKNSISNDHIYFIHLEDDAVWIGTNGSGLDRLDRKTGLFENYSIKQGLSNNVINGILMQKNKEYLWLSTNKGLCRLTIKTKAIKIYDADFGLQSNLFRRRACFQDPDGRMYFGGLQGLSAFYPEEVSDNPVIPVVHINELQVFDEDNVDSQSFFVNMLDQKSAELKHHQNSFIVDFIGLSFTMSSRNNYKYRLAGFDKNWRQAGVRRQAEYTNVPPGEYLFQVQASNSDGLWNEEGDTIQIVIKPAWWETASAIISALVLVVALVIIVYKWRVRYYKQQKSILENVVQERTLELYESREEIRAQRDELEVQTQTLSRQTKEMSDSINYASRIQKALLSSGESLNDNLLDNFIYFKPRDIVSGDFYWSGKIGGKLAVVAADCTGHGVPGAFLSILGIAFLNEIVALNETMSAAEVLSHLRERVKRIFKGSTSRMVSDGLDMAICLIDNETNTLEYAGAYNPLYYIRSNRLEILHADTMPIGYYVREQKGFTNHILKIEPGDKFYIFTDGYVDQFGGANGHKFMLKNFRNLILSIHDLPFQEQGEMLHKNIERYRGNFKQVDDILVMGFQVL